MIPALVEAFRSGEGLAWDAYPGLIEAQELANRPVFRNLLTQEWLPAIPDVHTRLLEGARVADVATGAGWSAIAMARAFPNTEVDGLDIDPESIERARRNAAAEGVDPERLRFHLVDAGQHSLDGQYDLVTIFEAVHDMARPAEVLATARRLLKADGAVLIADERVAETFIAPGDEAERLFYGYSVVACLANGLIDQPSIATGTVLRPAALEAIARDAGFSGFTVLDTEHESFRFYRLDP
jgi:2-polyprenyl-3-methyl-5-hydroxy-6-metoxy-1,4-benzoquinol methylase